MDSIALACLLIAAVLLAFVVLRALWGGLPYRAAAPPERFRWPVWRWYPLVIAGLLIVALAASVIYQRSRPARVDLPERDLQLQSGHSGTPAPPGR